MSYKLDYEQETNKKRLLNFERDKELISKIENYAASPNWLKEKIRNESLKYNNYFTQEDIFNEIKQNTNLVRHYIRDPVKQSIHQNLAKEHLLKYLANIVDIVEPECLKSTFLTPTGILTTKQLNGNKAVSKSIDFLIIGKNNVYAITHKYTKESGGSQDNQFSDVVKFLTNCPNKPKYLNKDLIVTAMIDGNYYNNKIEDLRDTFSSKWYLIGSIAEVIEKIIQFESL